MNVAADLAVDAHVHLHAEPDLMRALEAAAVNFASLSGVRSRRAVLLLADPAGHDSFARLAALPQARPADDGIAEGLWFEACGWRLLVAPGRQVVSGEGIEVLVLGTRRPHPDGLAFDDTLRRAQADDALVVLPWGCGKWWGARGRRVRHALARGAGLLLGDNGGRPAFWRDRILAEGRRRGIPILPGSDPLPLPGQSTRLGSFGFVLPLVDATAPLAGVKRALRAPKVEVRAFGACEQPARFVANQWRLRRRSRASSATEIAA